MVPRGPQCVLKCNDCAPQGTTEFPSDITGPTSNFILSPCDSVWTPGDVFGPPGDPLVLQEISLRHNERSGKQSYSEDILQFLKKY